MSSKADLLAAVALGRAAIRRDVSDVRAELDLAAKIQNSVRSRPFAWLGGAAAIGYLLAGPKTRTRTVTKIVRVKSGEPAREPKHKALGLLGMLLSIFKLAIPLARPALSAYAAKRFGDFAQKLAK